MVSVAEVAENIYLIDDQVCSLSNLGSVYLINEARKALVDSGPPSSAGVVLRGIKEVGIRPEDIDYIIVTHVHLDHAGGAGVLLSDMPQARVVVHHRGAKHLVRLAELMESARKTQGAEIMSLYGEVVPVGAERMQVVHDNDSIRLSEEQVLDFIDAPGHASHELCIYERRNGGVFTGDALGLYLAGGEVLLACHPPPGFDVEACRSTIERLMALDATRLYFAHFGASTRVREILQLALEEVRVNASLVAEAVRENALDGLAERMITQATEKLEPLKKTPSLYEFVTRNLVASGVAGFIDYYQRRSKN